LLLYTYDSGCAMPFQLRRYRCATGSHSDFLIRTTGVLRQLCATTARWQVARLNPVCADTSSHVFPWPRSARICSAFTVARGLPMIAPRLLAASIPLFVLAIISDLSSSAMDANIPKTNLPLGVLVSTPSCKLTKLIPSASHCLWLAIDVRHAFLI